MRRQSAVPHVGEVVLITAAVDGGQEDAALAAPEPSDRRAPGLWIRGATGREEGDRVLAGLRVRAATSSSQANTWSQLPFPGSGVRIPAPVPVPTDRSAADTGAWEALAGVLLVWALVALALAECTAAAHGSATTSLGPYQGGLGGLTGVDTSRR